VTVYSAETGEKSSTQIVLPAVFRAPIRPDVVTFVHDNMRANRRQAYGVFTKAGHQHSAESWGTGRAVARIPRISGGGTNRSGQGAFGNMCRKGRMFAPTKVWRRWHRRINQNQRRYATASALAASALPALVEARGHRVSNLPQVPLVVDGSLEKIKTTKKAVEVLKKLGAFDDVERCKSSRTVRSGQGKMRNRRHVIRRGPLVVYDKDEGIRQAFRNLPGVDLCSVHALNLLQLAPGGHLGRFIVWTADAFKALDSVFGTTRKKSTEKAGYNLPQAAMFNADIARIINSNEVQVAVREAKPMPRKTGISKNPLNNLNALLKLNPYAQTFKRNETLFAEARRKARATKAAAARK
jgi:large subunit ribosomal protein L4e